MTIVALDKISEIISHFVGEFALINPEDRMRDDNDGFRYRPDEDAEFDDQATTDQLLRVPYDTAGVTPGLTPFWFGGLPEAAQVFQGGLAGIEGPTIRLHLGAPDLITNLRIRMEAPPPFPQFAVPLPGSVVVVTHQMNILSDNDVILDDPNAVYIPAAAFEAQLDTLIGVAQALAPVAIGDPLTVLADAPGYFTALSADYAAAATMDHGDASVTVLSGADAMGITVNGVQVDEAPALKDVLPQYFAQDDESPEEDAPEDTLAAGGSAGIAAEIFDVADGHALVAGGNLVINEAVLVSAPIDAAFIAVMGDMVSLTAISQVSVVQDHDSGPIDHIAPTQAINAATIALASSIPDDAEPDPDLEDILPGAIGVTRIEGDLVCVNWLHQYNFITDTDVAQLTYSGEDTYIQLGGNTTLNQISLLELAMSYDVIIIGGQMIDMSLIMQTNVLLDDDHVSYGGDWPASVWGADNLLYNSATVSAVGMDSYTGMTGLFADAGKALADGATTLSAEFAQDATFLGHPALSVLYIDGDLINLTMVEQTNILGDADQVAIQLAALEDRPEVPDGPVTVTAGSNAVVNIATILEFGMDSTVMVGGEVYDDVLLFQANLIDTDEAPLDAPIAPLATEAVAFLADGLLSSPSDSDETFIVPTGDAGASPDVMQSVLA